MKRFIFFLLMSGVLFAGIGASLFAQIQSMLPEHHFAAGSGSWSFTNDRLFQNARDSGSRLAKVNFRAPQSGPMIYEFNVRYEDSFDKTHAGFGLHIFANNVVHNASWGSGASYLLWLNYDENPITPGIHKGLSAQVYRSRSNSVMDLIESVDLNEYAAFLTPEDLAHPIPFKIWADGNTGEVRVYDPTDAEGNAYFYFFVDRSLVPLRGEWASLRVNGARLSFGL